MTEITVNFGGQDIAVNYGENTVLARQKATEAAASASAAALSEAAAEALVGPIYASTALGLAGTVDGEFFPVDNGDGTVTIYENESGAATSRYSLATTAALASTDSGKGDELVASLCSGTGAVARTVHSKLADIPSPFDFDISEGNDSTTGFQQWLNASQAEGIAPHSTRRLTIPISDTVEMGVPADGTDFTGLDLGKMTLLYSGTRDRPAFKIDGTSGGAFIVDQQPFMRLPRVVASGALQWPGALIGTGDIGILLANVFRARIYMPYVDGFTKGYELRNSSYNAIYVGHLQNNKYAEVLSTSGALALFEYTNENTIYKGRRGCSSLAALLGDAYGTVLCWDEASSYRGHNANVWHEPCYELAAPAGATYRVPLWVKGVGAYNHVHDARVEGCKGPTAIFDGGGSNLAHSNTFEAIYNDSTGQTNALLQVNDAAGNIYTGTGAKECRWRSPDLGPLLSSNGAANGPYLRGPVALMDASGSALTRSTTIAARAITNTKALQLNGAGAFVAVDTTKIKTFRAVLSALSGFAGRICVGAFNSSGTRLTGDATDATWGNEPYVKGSGFAATASGNYGGVYIMGNTDGTQDVIFTVRSEVAKIYVGLISGTNPIAAQSLEIIGYAEPEDVNNTSAKVGLRVYADISDDGSMRLASAKPDTAGTHGYYAKGQKIYSTSVAAAATDGWPCSTAGWLAAAWVASTAYAVPGHVVTNDSGKMYELVTAGTSAGSGGPAGTSSGIADGTCVWNYIGVKAALVTSAVTT